MSIFLRRVTGGWTIPPAARGRLEPWLALGPECLVPNVIAELCFLAGLHGQIALVAKLSDLVHLGLKPIDMLFLILQQDDE